MKKVLIAVDDTKGSQAAVTVFEDVFSSARPESVLLIYVEKPEGRSLMDEMLGEAELSTLREALKGTEYQEAMDRRAKKILVSYKTSLEGKGVTGIKTVVKIGHPAEEILKTAKEESAGLIVMGSRGKRTHTILLGSVSREIVNNSEIPVLIAK